MALLRSWRACGVSCSIEIRTASMNASIVGAVTQSGSA
jgi:hypothetical protein